MITAAQKKKITDVLTKHYSLKIIAHLSENKIFNAKGNEFSVPSIQKIVLGVYNNEIVEMEIAKLVAKVKNDQKEAQKIKKQLFK